MIRRTSLYAILALFSHLLLASPILAGGGPETTLVVVNANSPISRQVANEYVALRDIPDHHVVYLDEIPSLGVITLDQFKERIWAPIDAYLIEQGIEDRIDLITYSADFPYAVNFRSVLDNPRPGAQIGGVASLTGVTYLIRHVLAGEQFWNLGINRYFRLDTTGGNGGAGPGRPPTAEEQKLIAQATAAIGQKNYRAAGSLYLKLAGTYKHGTHLYNLACCLARLGKQQEALTALSEAVNHGFRNVRLAAADPDLASLRSIPAFRQILGRIKPPRVTLHPGHGFRSSVAWTGAREPMLNPPPEAGGRYYLSTQLGFTGRYGNSLPEVLACLKRAAASDGTNPDGTVYICKNTNVRSTAREKFFPMLMEGLKKLGRPVEILEKGGDGQTGIIPVGKSDVIGAVVGTASFRWPSGKSVMLKGAICEHLTSFGAHFGTPGQTKLSEFIRHGAAGASGTVVEPLAIHQKFPNPVIHVFYAEGCSLAEAFYQSIQGPYQLLVVGDGLARPFAKFDRVRIDAPKSPWTGTVVITPKGPAGSFEFWVDGRRVEVGEKFSVDTTQLEDGHHDVRVVWVSDDDVETRSYKKLDAVVANRGRHPEIESSDSRVEYGEMIVFKSRGVKEIQALHHGRVVATTTKSALMVASTDLGPGPVTLIPRVILRDGSAYRGEPRKFGIILPAPVKSETANLPRKSGLRGKAKTAAGEVVIAVTNLGNKAGGKLLRDQLKSVKQVEWFELAGEFEIKQAGTWQLSFTGTGDLSLEVAGQELCADTPLDRLRSFAVSLEQGWHSIRIRVAGGGAPNLQMFLSGESVLDIPKLRHASHEALSSPPAPEKTKPGNPILVPAEGLLLSSQRSVRNISAIVLTPAAKSESFPTEWIVEVRSGRTKWKAVKDVVLLVGQGPKAVPQWVELTFKPLKTKALRVRPRNGNPTSLGKVEVLGKRIS